MELDDLLSLEFDVSDALEPSRRALLASACQQLDIAPARPSLGAARAARVEGERRKALRQALATTHELVASSRFDLQVLAVLMRLCVEVHGVVGVRAALSMIVKLIDQSWGALERDRELVSGSEREKLDRRRGSYLDAVFEQIYVWIARERERSAAELAQAFVPERSAWLELVERVDNRVARSSSKVSRWALTREALDACLRASEAPAHEAEAPATPPVQSEPPVSAAPLSVASLVASTSDPPAAQPVAAPVVAIAPALEQATAQLEVSPRFWELSQRLAAFRVLLEGGQIDKARIVAHDLGEVLEHFDVASFFPGLFAGYFELSARHAEALSGAAPLDAVRRAALAQLYRTDLNRFLQLSLDRHG
jgi:hypothetical protein